MIIRNGLQPTTTSVGISTRVVTQAEIHANSLLIWISVRRN